MYEFLFSQTVRRPRAHESFVADGRFASDKQNPVLNFFFLLQFVFLSSPVIKAKKRMTVNQSQSSRSPLVRNSRGLSATLVPCARKEFLKICLNLKQNRRNFKLSLSFSPTLLAEVFHLLSFVFHSLFAAVFRAERGSE